LRGAAAFATVERCHVSNRAEQAAALVLRAVDYGEADRVVTLLTRELGCVSAMAKAARKSKRRFAGALEGFALIHVELSTGRGALSRLESARVTRVFPKLLTNLAALDAAGALLRLAREILPERAPEPAVFDSLIEALDWLDRGTPPLGLKLCCQARMLGLTGFAPLLSACVGCGREPRAGQPALFDAVRGGIVCRACGGGPERMSAQLRIALVSALEGAPLDALCAVMSEAQLREAERLLSQFITQQLQGQTKPDTWH
jgi:DNA repair protein RecO (recombination protein O)